MAPTLLYIDSEAATRRLVATVLATADVRVVQAATLAQAREIVEAELPDVVLVDIDVVGVDVDDVISGVGLRSSPACPIFIAATADDRPQHLSRANAAGFAAILVKPLDVDRLVADVCRHLPIAAPRAAESRHGVRDVRERERGDARHWRRTLMPLIVNLVRNGGTSEGVLALLEETRGTLVVAAAHSLRSNVVLPAYGTRVPVGDVPWLGPALSPGQPVLLEPETVQGSPLLAAECSIALAVPVVDAGQTYGVVVLGERRQRTFGLPPGQIARCVAETGKIAAVVRQFADLDEKIARSRREIDDMRIAVAWAVAGQEGDPGTREAFVRLSSRLAERLEVPETLRPIVAYAQRVHDVGRLWLGRTVLPLSGLSAAEAEALLNDHGEHTLEILTGLDCPPLVVDVVRASRRPWSEAPDEVGRAPGIVAVVAAYQALTDGGESDGHPLRAETALAEIAKGAGSRFDPIVVDALLDLVTEPRVDDRGQSS